MCPFQRPGPWVCDLADGDQAGPGHGRVGAGCGIVARGARPAWRRSPGLVGVTEGAGDMDAQYDLVIIGSGPAGDSAAQLAASHGYRVAIVERLRAPGGVVVANGGVPVRTLPDAAKYLTGFLDRQVYGLGLEIQPQLLLDKLA